MKAIAVFLLFLGMLLIIKGYYSNKYKKQTQPKVIVKYIPRSEYEAQMSDQERLHLEQDVKLILIFLRKYQILLY